MPILLPVPIPSTGSFEVVGESHYQDGIRAMAAPGAAIAALLVAEIGNPYDESAVRVLLTNRRRAETAGYLSAESAKEWWPILADLARHGKVATGSARFIGGTADRPTMGVRVDVVDPPSVTTPLEIDVNWGLPQRPSELATSVTPPVVQKSSGCGVGCLVVVVVVVIIAIVLWVAAKANPDSSESTSSSSSGNNSAPSRVEVRYEVTGTSAGAAVTYSTPTGTQQHKTGLPMMNTGGTPGVGFTTEPGEFVYISAQNQSDFGEVTCKILVDGVVISENTASGAYSIAQCDGTAR